MYQKPLLLLVLSIVLSGCMANVMTTLPPADIAPPLPDKAKVVFMRASLMTSGVSADLIDVSDGQPKMIGALSIQQKIVYETTPGKKIFMTHGNVPDFMLADLSGGRIYYVLVRPVYFIGRMIPTPLRTDGTSDFNTGDPKFAKWLSDTVLVAPNTEAQAWFDKEKDRYRRIYEEAWPIFQAKSDSEKMERTLRAQDGVTR